MSSCLDYATLAMASWIPHRKLGTRWGAFFFSMLFFPRGFLADFDVYFFFLEPSWGIWRCSSCFDDLDQCHGKVVPVQFISSELLFDDALRNSLTWNLYTVFCLRTRWKVSSCLANLLCRRFYLCSVYEV